MLRPSFLSRPVLWFAGVAVAVFAVWYESPRELARWYAAAARDAELNADYVAMEAAATTALKHAPGNPDWYLLRARARIEQQNWQAALDDLARAQSGARAAAQEWNISRYRADVLQNLGQFSEALKIWKTIVSPLPRIEVADETQDPQELQRQISAFISWGNALSYARALARTELQQALRDARKVVRLANDERLRVAPGPYMSLAQAVTLVKTNRRAQALGLVNASIAELRRLIHRYQSRATAVNKFSPGKYHEKLQALRSMLVSAHVERYRIYIELKLAKPAAQAADAVGRLGGDVDEDGWGVDFYTGLESATTLCAVLDTLGLVELELGQTQQALAHLDDAVQIAQLLPQAQGVMLDIRRRQRVDVRYWERQSEEVETILAPLLYHRGMALHALGEHERAEADFTRIRKLGLEPGLGLF